MNKSSLQVTCNTPVMHKIQRKGGDVMKHDIHTINSRKYTIYTSYDLFNAREKYTGVVSASNL